VAYAYDAREFHSSGKPQSVLSVFRSFLNRRSQWPRGLRRRSAAACLLGLRIRIPLTAWISLCC